MWRARALLKARGGIDLPPVTRMLGRQITLFWSEVLRRERQEKLDLLDYIPAAMYLMAGVPESVEYDKRYSVLKPYKESLRGKITHQAYTTGHHRAKLKRSLAELAERRDQMHRLVAMDDEDFLSKWMTGKV